MGIVSVNLAHCISEASNLRLIRNTCQKKPPDLRFWTGNLGRRNDHCRSLYFHVVTTTFGVPSRPRPSASRRAVHASPSTHHSLFGSFGLAVEVSGLSRFGYLGQIPSVAYRGARSPPSSLTPSCNLSHSLPRNTQPAAASCTTVENRPLQCGTSNATMTIQL